VNPPDAPANFLPRLGIWPTPLPPLSGAPDVYVKREDLCGFAFGGSKVRALEPLLEQALRSGAEILVVGGRRDSNWVALAAIAASRVGLRCHCVFDPGAGTTNAMRLAGHFGATIRTASAPGAGAVNAAIDAAVAELGPLAFGIPRAGADAVGVLGYCAMMREILEQLPTVTPVDVVVALGSGGMTAGLVLGAQQNAPGRDIVVHAVPVSKSARQTTNSVAALLAAVRSRGLAEVDVDDALRRIRITPQADACGPRSSLATLARARSGTLPDPVFVAPAWAAFSAEARNPAGVVVFVASGGLPAVFDSLTMDRR
jgi:1-aminocyclopropane-1-carboxylate deaminase/D-cysteine desulfhydrase-like pyridoxal-dependent ACC family enzyme